MGPVEGLRDAASPAVPSTFPWPDSEVLRPSRDGRNRASCRMPVPPPQRIPPCGRFRGSRRHANLRNLRSGRSCGGRVRRQTLMPLLRSARVEWQDACGSCCDLGRTGRHPSASPDQPHAVHDLPYQPTFEMHLASSVSVPEPKQTAFGVTMSNYSSHTLLIPPPWGRGIIPR